MKQLDSVPKSKRLTLVSMILMVVIGLFYVVWWEPTRTQIEAVQHDIQQLEQEIQRDTNTTQELIELQAGVEELEKEMLKKGTRFYPGDGQMGLRRYVMKLAEKNGLAVVSWRPGLAVTNSQAGINRLPVHVRVQGGYHQIAKFFAEVLHVPAGLQINEFTMRVEKNLPQNPTLLTDFILTAIELSDSGTFPKLASSQEGQVLQRTGS